MNGAPTWRGSWRREPRVAAAPCRRTGSIRAAAGASRACATTVRSDRTQADHRLVRKAGNPERGLRQAAPGVAADRGSVLTEAQLARLAQQTPRDHAATPASATRPTTASSTPRRAARRTSRPGAAPRARPARGCAAGCRKSSSATGADSGFGCAACRGAGYARHQPAARSASRRGSSAVPADIGCRSRDG